MTEAQSMNIAARLRRLRLALAALGGPADPPDTAAGSDIAGHSARARRIEIAESADDSPRVRRHVVVSESGWTRCRTTLIGRDAAELARLEAAVKVCHGGRVTLAPAAPTRSDRRGASALNLVL